MSVAYHTVRRSGVPMSSHVMKISRNGQVSIPADARAAGRPNASSWSTSAIDWSSGHSRPSRWNHSSASTRTAARARAAARVGPG